MKTSNQKKDEISKHSIYYNSIQNYQGDKLCLFHRLQCKQEICKNRHMEQNNILLNFKLLFYKKNHVKISKNDDRYIIKNIDD